MADIMAAIQEEWRAQDANFRRARLLLARAKEANDSTWKEEREEVRGVLYFGICLERNIICRSVQLPRRAAARVKSSLHRTSCRWAHEAKPVMNPVFAYIIMRA
jgi:hypothetical protein